MVFRVRFLSIQLTSIEPVFRVLVSRRHVVHQDSTTLAYRVKCFLSLPLDPLVTLSSNHFTREKIASECDVTFERYRTYGSHEWLGDNLEKPHLVWVMDLGKTIICMTGLTKWLPLLTTEQSIGRKSSLHLQWHCNIKAWKTQKLIYWVD